MAVVNILCAPFILLLMLGRLVFAQSDEWYRSPATLGKRTWTPYARWLIREYNELPHIFDERCGAMSLCTHLTAHSLRRLHAPATAYLAGRSTQLHVVFARCVHRRRRCS